nr:MULTISPECIES: diguanylate cyclase [unclassified Exiguobacterium]
MLIDYEIIQTTDETLLFKLIKKVEATFIPLIIIGPNDASIRQTCYQLGADDYWDETVLIEERQIRLKRLLRKLRTVSATILVDELTGAFNRKYLQNAYRRRTSRLERDGQLFALAIFDLDHFKRINDLHGHPAGDLVLAELAVLTKQAIRQEDELIRFGGEEFMLLFSADDSEHAVDMMEKVRARIERHTFPNGLKVTVSIGLTVIKDAAMDLEEMTSEADEALYQAKRNGRNQVTIYSMATAKEKMEALIKIESNSFDQLVPFPLPHHPKYHFRIIPYDEKTVAPLQLCVLPLDQLAASNFKLLEDWKQFRDGMIEVIAIASEENQLLGQVLERGVTDYCLSPLDRDQLEEQIRQWTVRLP